MLLQPEQQRERIAQKRDTLLKFLASEGFSSLPIIAEVLQLGKPAGCKTLGQLARAGLVANQDVPAGAGVLKIYHLTPHGRAMAFDPRDTAQEFKDIEINRIAPSSIGHALDCQRLRLALKAQGWTQWQSDRELHVLNNLAKIPDAIANLPTGERAAIEVERTIKTKKRYQSILSEYVQMINAHQVQQVHYFSPIEGVAERVERIFKSVDYILIGTRRIQVDPLWLNRFKFQPFPTTKKELSA